MIYFYVGASVYFIISLIIMIFLWNKIRGLIVQLEEKDAMIDETVKSFDEYAESMLNYAIDTYKKYGIYSELNLFFLSIFDMFGIKVDKETKELIIPENISFIESNEDDEGEFNVFQWNNRAKTSRIPTN